MHEGVQRVVTEEGTKGRDSITKKELSLILTHITNQEKIKW